MREEVERLRRHYATGKISLRSINILLGAEKITRQEYNYIIAEV